jgi:hypothetical protein
MGSARWQPGWWTEERHGSAWERAKEAIRRDWEQTKSDLHLGGHDLHQHADDTVKQAIGKAPLPPAAAPTPHDAARPEGGAWSASMPWDDAEPALSYGYGAREEFGAKHATWNPALEEELRGEWERRIDRDRAPKWTDVQAMVRRGYEARRPA